MIPAKMQRWVSVADIPNIELIFNNWGMTRKRPELVPAIFALAQNTQLNLFLQPNRQEARMLLLNKG